MIRGLYTGSSGMMAQWNNINVISNNLANVNTSGYKKDISVFKSFPEMLMRRLYDDGVVNFNLGSYDKAPVIGKMGTGVEFNDVYTDFDQGLSIRRTENDLDIALVGKGFFTVETDRGHRYTRNGSFTLDENSYLVTQQGYKVLGENGPIQIKNNNFRVDEQGVITRNSKYNRELSEFVDKEENSFDYEEVVDRLKIVTFNDLRGLKKEGESLYVETPQSGKMTELSMDNGRPKVVQGYIETSNVNVVNQMVKMIETQRAYEANQKTVQTSDELMGIISNRIGRI
ncbi:MAG: flagellar basal-body rod protein FlgF [Spirochaetota bacterium]